MNVYKTAVITTIHLGDHVWVGRSATGQVLGQLQIDVERKHSECLVDLICISQNKRSPITVAIEELPRKHMFQVTMHMEDDLLVEICNFCQLSMNVLNET